MNYTLHLIPALMNKTQNYIYYLRDEKTGISAIIDSGDAKPTIEFLEKNHLKFHFILNTHHHWDHTDGNIELKKYSNGRAKIVGAKTDAHRIPGPLDIELNYGDTFSLGSIDFQIIHTPGHTMNHIAFYSKESKLLFCGDTMFSGGCGGLFEGTAEDMFIGFKIFSQMPNDVRVCCAHEYTRSNLEFARYLESNNSNIDQRIKQVEFFLMHGNPTIPSTILIEKETNPFMKFNDESLKKLLKIDKSVSEVEVFKEIMSKKAYFYRKA